MNGVQQQLQKDENAKLDANPSPAGTLESGPGGLVRALGGDAVGENARLQQRQQTVQVEVRLSFSSHVAIVPESVHYYAANFSGWTIPLHSEFVHR
jgi:hypothetical protein